MGSHEVSELIEVLLGQLGKQPRMAGYGGGDTPSGSARDRASSSMPNGVLEENVVLFAVPKKGRTRGCH